MEPTADDLDGYDNATVYEDATVVRVSIRRTDDDACPSGWRYTLHYGALTAGPETLDDGTIRRYDNSHEDTKGHELHVAPPRNRNSSSSLASRTSTNGSGTRFRSRDSVHPPTTVIPMTEQNVLVVTVDDETNPYEEGLEAIQTLKEGEQLNRPVTVRFPNESQLTDVFNERTYTLLRVIRDERPDSIRETARLVGRDKKNVHEELTTLEALGVIRFEAVGRAKKPIFPYNDLVVSPLAHDPGDGATAAP